MPPEKLSGGVVPVPWQVWQKENPPDAEGRFFAAVPCWEGWSQPAGCTSNPWHSVLLKHPGAVPAGAGGLGGGIGEFAPAVWQKAHTGAFPVAVVVWTYASPASHCDACGEFVIALWHG